MQKYVYETKMDKRSISSFIAFNTNKISFTFYFITVDYTIILVALQT